MRKKMMRRSIATLSAIFVVGGVAISSYAGLQIHEASVAQTQRYLPVAAMSWAKNPSPAFKRSVDVPLGTFIGTINIPSIGKTVNIFQGTTTNVLKNGAGHLLQSVLPGVADNSIIAGHRDTVFSLLGKVKIGSDIVITTRDGTFHYIVDRTRIVDKNDQTVIVSTKVATLTLSTCYPFIYIGTAPKRYIVVATLKNRAP